MPNYRRYHEPGGSYFFTVVTHNRRPFLTTEAARSSLRLAFSNVRKARPFEIPAIVLLPDHLHAVWSLPRGDSDFSTRWKQIKEQFTREWIRLEGFEDRRSSSRLRHGEKAIWQRRFWEHLCRDEEDLASCIDYIHWNPRKHGLVTRIGDYPWSSFHRFVRDGDYDPDWGATDPCAKLVLPGCE